jgi:hypothetical protein
MKEHQIFIASFQKDFVWLAPCLRSLKKQQGPEFLPPCISVDEQDFFEARKLAAQTFPEAIISVKNGRRGQGNLRAQIAMSEADLFCPDAKYIYLVGSDCIAHRPFVSDTYFVRGKPVMLYNYYTEFGGCPSMKRWQDITAQAVGFVSDKEFMRRLPVVYTPRSLARTRQWIEDTHHKPFETAVYDMGHFTESNVIGAVAWEACREDYTWYHANHDEEYLNYRRDNPDPLIQFWSHGGLNRPAETCVNYAFGNTHGKTPMKVMTELGLV